MIYFELKYHVKFTKEIQNSNIIHRGGLSQICSIPLQARKMSLKWFIWYGMTMSFINLLYYILNCVISLLGMGGNPINFRNSELT